VFIVIEPDTFVPLNVVPTPANDEPLNCNPLLFSVKDAAPVLLVPVPAYPRASSDNPDEFTVHVTLLCAVFRPIASFDALAVVNAL
jgi:hypothetical protein